MKKFCTYLSFLFFVNFCYSQFGSDYEIVQIVLKNGTVLDGYARVLLKDLDFKDSNKKNKRKVLFSEINSVKFTVFTGKKKSIQNELSLICIQLDSTEDKNSYVLAEQILDRERIKIYGVYMLEGGGFSMGPGLGGQISPANMKFGSSNINTYADFYCLISNEKFPRLIYNYSNFLKTFRIMASECFKDCEELSAKINSKEFEKENIIDIGIFYNDKCN